MNGANKLTIKDIFPQLSLEEQFRYLIEEERREREKESRTKRKELIGDIFTFAVVAGCALIIGVPSLNEKCDRLLSLPISHQQQSKNKNNNSVANNGYTFPIPSRKGQKPVSIPGDCRPLGSCTRRHAGADYGAPIGTPIVAIKSGTVIEVNPDASVGGILGIKADDGEVFHYVHMSRDSVRRWKIGDKVAQGQKILSVGYEGRAWGSGPHLHIERYFKNGQLDSKVHVWLEGAK